MRYRGILMTAKRARTLKYINKDSSPIDKSPTLPATTTPETVAINQVPAASLTTANDKPKPREFRIMALPFDVREKILQFVALDFIKKRSPSLNLAVYLPGINGKTSTAIRLPPITQAGDRKLRLETILITLKLVTLEIHSGPGNAMLQKWLESLRLDKSGQTTLCAGFDAVHSLEFPYFSRYPFHFLPANAPNNDVELMRRCNTLRHVKVNFVLSTLYGNPGSLKTVAELRKDYRLDGMLELQNLRTLVLEHPGVDDQGKPLLTPLKKWFEGEFAKKGQVTTVTF